MEEAKTKKYRDYHKGIPAKIERADGIVCSNPSCTTGPGNDCKLCGFNMEEAERRKTLPLIADENGIRRKYVGKHIKNDG